MASEVEPSPESLMAHHQQLIATLANKNSGADLKKLNDQIVAVEQKIRDSGAAVPAIPPKA